MELDVDRLARASLGRQSNVFKVVVEACAEDNDITAETAAEIGRKAEEGYAAAVHDVLADFGWTPG